MKKIKNSKKSFPPVDNQYDLLKKNINTIIKEVFDHKRPKLLKGINPRLAELCEKKSKARLNFIKKTTYLENLKISTSK